MERRMGCLGFRCVEVGEVLVEGEDGEACSGSEVEGA
jgi:hypothetical protein